MFITNGNRRPIPFHKDFVPEKLANISLLERIINNIQNKDNYVCHGFRNAQQEKLYQSIRQEVLNFVQKHSIEFNEYEFITFLGQKIRKDGIKMVLVSFYAVPKEAIKNNKKTSSRFCHNKINRTVLIEENYIFPDFIVSRMTGVHAFMNTKNKSLKLFENQIEANSFKESGNKEYKFIGIIPYTIQNGEIYIQMPKQEFFSSANYAQKMKEKEIDSCVGTIKNSTGKDSIEVTYFTKSMKELPTKVIGVDGFDIESLEEGQYKINSEKPKGIKYLVIAITNFGKIKKKQYALFDEKQDV